MQMLCPVCGRGVTVEEALYGTRLSAYCSGPLADSHPEVRMDEMFTPPINANRGNPTFATDFLSADRVAQSPFIGDAINSGSQRAPVTAGLVTKDHPGVALTRSSSTANSGYRFMTENDRLLLGGGETFELIFAIETLANLTFRLGFFDTETSADAVDGAYIEIPSTGAAVGKTANNSTRTTSSTIATLSAGLWYRALISVNFDASEVTFYLYSDDGTELGSQTITTNIPTASGRETGVGMISTNAGTVATDMVNLDWMAMWYNNRSLVRG